MLLFSTQPGCREAHLERRYKNLLFSGEVRQVTQQQINAARQADDAEVIAFQEDFRALLRDIATLTAHVESEVILKLKERIECLYEIRAGLPGDFSREREGLERLNYLIMDQIKQGAADDPYAQEQLKREETARAFHWHLLRQPLVAHLLRPNSPIPPEDLIPTLLSEDEESIRAVMALLSIEQRSSLRIQARQWLERLQVEKTEIPDVAWGRLEILEENVD